MNLALFDLDHTLLPIDSDYEWGQYLVRLGVVDAATHKLKNEQFFAQYNAGTLDIYEFLEFAFATLKAHPREQLERWQADFMREVITPAITPRAKNLVAEHRDAGDLCAIVTATNSFVTRPIARAFGIDHLIASEPREVDGRFTGEVHGTPCFKEGKIARTEAWLASLGHAWDDFSSSTFYSDSANDIPLLEKVRVPVAVNPSEKLKSYAIARGWPVIDLHSS
ncbi:MAG TPA: HAD family hydrolase [Burkholderiaceae bacterium]|nr:HAD family hydrolase [Burkholderiaceae bacterium]